MEQKVAILREEGLSKQLSSKRQDLKKLEADLDQVIYAFIGPLMVLLLAMLYFSYIRFQHATLPSIVLRPQRQNPRRIHQEVVAAAGREARAVSRLLCHEKPHATSARKAR